MVMDDERLSYAPAVRNAYPLSTSIPGPHQDDLLSHFHDDDNSICCLVIIDDISQALNIGLLTNLLKSGTYYAYERVWDRITWGIPNQ